MLRRYEQFSAVVSSLNRGIQKLEREEMVKHGYKGAYAQYLTLLRRYPEGLPLTRICEACDKDKAAVSRMIAELVEKGLVERCTSGERIYKARIRLTEQGSAVAEFVSVRAQAAVATVNDALTEDERIAFYAALEKIAEKLEILTREGIPEGEQNDET